MVGAGAREEVHMTDTRNVRLPDGSEVKATPLAIRESSEQWSEYHLEDGTVVRMKVVAAEVLRAPGQFDAEGNPL